MKLEVLSCKQKNGITITTNLCPRSTDINKLGLGYNSIYRIHYNIVIIILHDFGFANIIAMAKYCLTAVK